MNMMVVTTNAGSKLPEQDEVKQQQLQQPKFLTAKNMVTVEHPLEDDILCGKDKRCITHKGSVFFKGVIEAHTTKYREAMTRQGKMEVTKNIFDMLQSRRFLKYNDETNVWEVLHPLAIRDKIGHALRFANRNSRSKTSSSSSSSSATCASKQAMKKLKEQQKRDGMMDSSSSSASSSDSDDVSDRARFLQMAATETVLSSTDSTPFQSRPNPASLQRQLATNILPRALQAPSNMSLPELASSSTGNGVPGEVSFFNLVQEVMQTTKVAASLTSNSCPSLPMPSLTSRNSTGSNSGAVVDAKMMENKEDDDDLSWVMQLPIMEEDPSDNKIYFCGSNSSLPE